MPSAVDYIAGVAQPELTQDNVTAPWATGHRCINKLAMANRAFELYYTAVERIDRIHETELRQKASKQLYYCLTSGCGSGVSDLKEAFEHLAEHHDEFRDENMSPYFPGPGKCFVGNALVHGPTFAVNFLNAVDRGMQALKATSDELGTYSDQINVSIQRDDWDNVGRALGKIKKSAETIKPWLWDTPTAVKHAGRIATFANALGNIHAGTTTFANSRRAGFHDDMSAAIGAIRTAVGFVPVLGSFYGKAIEMIPGLATWFNGIIRDRVRRLDRIANSY